MLEFLLDTILVAFGGKVFQQIVGIPMGTIPSRHMSLLIRSGIHALFVVDEKEQFLVQPFSTSHVDTSISYCRLIILTLRIMWFRCFPLNLRVKTRWRAALLRPTWVYSCRSGGTCSFVLPFATNMTISTSILQTFGSRLAIFHLFSLMAVLSHISYDM